MTLFERIQELAKKRDKTLKDISLELGYSKNYLYTLQKQSPKAENLKIIADYFNVSTDYLLGRTDDPNTGVSPDDRKLTVEEALKTVMSSDGKPLTDNDRAILSAMIEAYLEKKDN